MANTFKSLIARIRKSAKPRAEKVTTTAMGRERHFIAYDLDNDTFILEDKIHQNLNARPSVLVIPKEHLRKHAKGMVMTITTGNHSVAAFPILDGRFWKLARLKPEEREAILMKHILCANIVNDVLELSQRDVGMAQLISSDEWLQKTCKLNLDDVIMLDRNELVIQHYRELGQDWRVKPLAWTESGQKLALDASKKRIASKLRYYHNSRGVHFLTLPEFRKLITFAETDEGFPKFMDALKEMVSIQEGNRYSFVRMPKYRGHHEIELFGLRRGAAMDRIIPELDKLMESLTVAKIGREYALKRVQAIAKLYEESLTSPDLANAESHNFIETLYMHVTGEVYSAQNDSASVAFDDRRTALPGATYVDGRPVFHPGIDERSKVLLSNLRLLLSKDEIPISVNIYEIRTPGDMEDSAVGHGKTREVVFTTNWRPIETAFVEKRLVSGKKGYGAYTMTRVGALKALGIDLPTYNLLRRRMDVKHRDVDYFIRSRCEGEPIDSIPQNYFMSMEDSSVEDPRTVLDVAMKMGDAAAQAMIMKKYDAKTETPLFGEKEVYEFEYSVGEQRVAPRKVMMCSIRGSFGWPCLDRTDENIANIGSYYMGFFAHELKRFQAKHSVPMMELAERFMEGFEYRTNATHWQLSIMRDKLENFHPGLPKYYDFDRKWQFILWSLERQERRLQVLRRKFLNKVSGILQNENLRNNS